MMWETINSIATVLLGGGVIATLATLRSTRRKAETESQEKSMELSKLYVDEFKENIVSPLRQTVDENKKEMASLKREMSRLRKAIDKSKTCDYSDNCPVRNELHKLETDDAELESEREGGT